MDVRREPPRNGIPAKRFIFYVKELVPPKGYQRLIKSTTGSSFNAHNRAKELLLKPLYYVS